MSWSPFVSALGITIILIGTVVLCLPDLPRSIRIRYYGVSRQLRDYYETREYVKSAGKGRMFNFSNRVICYTFVDYIDMNHRYDLPDGTPNEIETGAVKIRAKEEDEWHEYQFQSPKRAIVDILDLTIERECRMSGISIALIGTLIAITGALL